MATSGSVDGDEFDPGYKEAMERLEELKAKPIDQLTEAEKKEKLRLANRESARKMRRKQADSLMSAEGEVGQLEAENREYMNKLAEGWYKYKEIRAENELLKGELQALQAFQASVPQSEGAAAGEPTAPKAEASTSADADQQQQQQHHVHPDPDPNAAQPSEVPAQAVPSGAPPSDAASGHAARVPVNEPLSAAPQPLLAADADGLHAAAPAAVEVKQEALQEPDGSEAPLQPDAAAQAAA